jgi:hypothetical protein
LRRLSPDSLALWDEAQPCLQRERGILVVDDTTLDKPCAQAMGLVIRHWSGKYRRMVQGLNWISWVWTEGDARLPFDFRIYAAAIDGATKNTNFQQLLVDALRRGFQPTPASLGLKRKRALCVTPSVLIWQSHSTLNSQLRHS